MILASGGETNTMEYSFEVVGCGYYLRDDLARLRLCGFYRRCIFPPHRRLAEAGIAASVGSVGDSYDNAMAETINGLYKTEVIRKRGPWRNVDEVEYATLEWVDWFNNRRLLQPIGDIPPAEYETVYYQKQTQAIAA